MKTKLLFALPLLTLLASCETPPLPLPDRTSVEIDASTPASLLLSLKEARNYTVDIAIYSISGGSSKLYSSATAYFDDFSYHFKTSSYDLGYIQGSEGVYPFSLQNGAVLPGEVLLRDDGSNVDSLWDAGLFGSFCPTGLTASAITQVAYTLADGSSVTLNAVSEPTDSMDADSASSAAYETVWRLASDPAASLAQDKVQSLLSALCTYVTAQATDADLAACGFDAPVFTATVTSEDGSAVQLAYACGTDGWYLQVEGDTSVYTVDTSTVQALLLTENDLKTQE